MKTGPMAGSAMEKLKSAREETVDEAVSWLFPPSTRSKVRVEPESTLRTGLRELSHLRWEEDLETWKEWVILM